eukprot:734211-Pyramimonas_sp.AAC.1
MGVTPYGCSRCSWNSVQLWRTHCIDGTRSCLFLSAFVISSASVAAAWPRGGPSPWPLPAAFSFPPHSRP